MLVVFVDLIGQGLVFPIINSLVMEPATGFLPTGTSETGRHLSYGLVIGIFFLAWFLGGPYISRLSDMIGRKKAILICLFGALAGYAITIVSLYADSLILLIVGRAITGFTAGNQPIAQAAMIDGSVDETDRARNMGYIITGISFGLVGGPIIGGLLSDPAVLGRFASLQLPFYASFVLVALVIVLILHSFEDTRQEREPLVLRPMEVFEILWRVREYPVVMRLTAVLFFFHVANVTFYIFVDNYLTSRFGYGEFGGSMAMLTIGVALAVSSTFFVVPAQKRFDKKSIIMANLMIWAACAAAFILSPAAILCFVPIFIFYFVFGISYSTFLAVFAASVGDEEQGWVMGITVAVFTFIAGIMSVVGGDLMSIDIRLPFYVVITAALAGCVVIPIAWGNARIRPLLQRGKT